MSTPQYGPTDPLPLHAIPGPGDDFSWTSWDFHPDAYLVLAGFIGLYIYGWRTLGAARQPDNRLRPRHVSLFAAAMLTLFVFSATPVHELSDFLFSAHMSEHLVLMMVLPPLLIGGTPDWMLRPLIRDPIVLRVARELTKPVTATVIFNVVLVGTHLPIAIDVMQHHAWAHFLLHALEVAAGVVMWWPVVSPLRELPPLEEPWRMGYLFVQSFVPTVPASFLTFGGNVLNDVYAEVPRIWGTTAIGDQRVSGLIMKVGGGLYLWGFITVLFFRWFEEEDAKAQGLPTWSEAEEELERMGLT